MTRLPPTRVRLRLTLWYVASIAVLVIGYAAALLWTVRSQSMADVDRALRQELSTLVDSFVLGQQVAGLSDPLQTSEFAEPGQATLEVWMLDPETASLTAGRRLRGSDVLPMSAPTPDVAARRAPFNLERGTSTWRVMQAGTSSRERGSVLFRASLPLEPVEKFTRELAQIAGWGLLGVLLLACLGGVLIAGQALAPIEDIIRRTRAIRPGALADRLPQTPPFDEVTELARVINDLLARVQQALEKQAQFATEAAHELRTPLTAQRSVGELALRGQLSGAELRAAISTMLEESEHMQRLIDSLLTVARADAGMLATAAAPVDVSALANACIRRMQPLADVKGQKLTVMVDQPRFVIAEETLLRQALLNLVHNAIKHTGDASSIAVRIEADADEVMILVMDNGPGFAPFEANQVVRRMARPPTNRSERGLGLGLTIAHSLVRSQGGRMTVESQPGLGTVVGLRFDAAPAPTLPPVSAGTAP